MAEIIRDIKMSDAKLWFIKLYDDGYFYSTIASIRGVCGKTGISNGLYRGYYPPRGLLR